MLTYVFKVDIDIHLNKNFKFKMHKNSIVALQLCIAYILKKK